MEITQLWFILLTGSSWNDERITRKYIFWNCGLKDCYSLIKLIKIEKSARDNGQFFSMVW